MGMGGPPAGKTKNVGQTLRRLLGRLRPELHLLGLVAVFGSISVGFSVVGPKIIGNATNIVFNGIVGKSLPAGTTKAQAIAYLSAHGQGQLAQMLSGWGSTSTRWPRPCSLWSACTCSPRCSCGRRAT